MSSLPDLLLFSLLGAAIFFALCGLLEERRIRWERSRGLYAREQHAGYLMLTGMAWALWRRPWSRLLITAGLAALVCTGILRGRSLIVENGWPLGIYGRTQENTEDAVKKELERKQAWLARLEALRIKSGAAVYCPEIQSQMAQLRKFQKRTVSEQGIMRILSENWTRHCESAAQRASEKA